MRSPILAAASLLLASACGEKSPDPSGIDPSRFVSTIDNPFLPLTPGTTRIYDDNVGGRSESRVTAESKTISGVACTEVRTEETSSWYAQDRDGAVWAFDETTAELVMPAQPEAGKTVHVPFGQFTNCAEMHHEMASAFYCPGIGLALSILGDLRRELVVLAPSYDPMIDPARFVAGIDNPFFPLTPGSTRTYVEVRTDGSTERVEFTVTNETKTILGVTCTVVQDRAFVDDVLEEDTFDWFAQDGDGAVWYFGEDTHADDGSGALTDTSGSWEAGVHGARPGIIMRAHPAAGDPYREEFLAGSAEDEAQVIGVNETVDVPYGSFAGCVQTKNYTRLDPAIENKFYCPGVGETLVLEEGVRGELVSFTRP